MYPGVNNSGSSGTPAKKPKHPGEWRDQTRKPRGMARFSRWHHPPLGRQNVYPSDMDGAIHSRNGNRVLFFEFKPVGMPDVQAAQAELLSGLSLKPGQQCIVIFDPCWDDESEEKYDPSARLRTILYRDGKRHDSWTTVAKLSAAVSDWYYNRGSLAQP